MKSNPNLGGYALMIVLALSVMAYIVVDSRTKRNRVNREFALAYWRGEDVPDIPLSYIVNLA